MSDLDLRELMTATRTGDPRARPVLSPRQREVVELRLRGFSFAYAGRAMGVTETTARTHYRFAIENLQLELSRRGVALDPETAL